MLRYLIERRLELILNQMPKYKILTDEKRINDCMLFQAQNGERRIQYTGNRLKYYGMYINNEII